MCNTWNVPVHNPKIFTTMAYNTEKQYRYTLQKCSTGRPKLICPNCGHKTFVPYIDTESGTQVHETCGRCDRENSCAYHLTPREYFANSGKAPDKQYYFPKKELAASSAPFSFSTMNRNIVDESMQDIAGNNFALYLFEKYQSCDVVEALRKYKVGTHNYWPSATIFWQIDTKQRVRTGKIMLYNYKTGHRVKEPQARIIWVHSLKPFENYHLKQCLFGSHLITESTKRVMVVEAEKTAVIASMFFPDEVWVATGGLGNLRAETCEVLAGKQVVLFPDLGAEEKWAEKASTIPALKNCTISTWLTRNATPWQRNHGCDLADEIEQWEPTARPNIEAFL